MNWKLEETDPALVAAGVEVMLDVLARGIAAGSEQREIEEISRDAKATLGEEDGVLVSGLIYSGKRLEAVNQFARLLRNASPFPLIPVTNELCERAFGDEAVGRQQAAEERHKLLGFGYEGKLIRSLQTIAFAALDGRVLAVPPEGTA